MIVLSTRVITVPVVKVLEQPVLTALAINATTTMAYSLTKGHLVLLEIHVDMLRPHVVARQRVKTAHRVPWDLNTFAVGIAILPIPAIGFRRSPRVPPWALAASTGRLITTWMLHVAQCKVAQQANALVNAVSFITVPSHATPI